MYYEVGSQLEQNNDFFNKCFYSKVFIKKVFKKSSFNGLSCSLDSYFGKSKVMYFPRRPWSFLRSQDDTTKCGNAIFCNANKVEEENELRRKMSGGRK